MAFKKVTIVVVPEGPRKIRQIKMPRVWIPAFGVLFLVLLYIGFLPGLESLQIFGPINDVCVLI